MAGWADMDTVKPYMHHVGSTHACGVQGCPCEFWKHFPILLPRTGGPTNWIVFYAREESGDVIGTGE